MNFKINKAKVSRILIIKLRGIGDVVLSTIIFDTLLREFPNAKIDFLTEKPSNQILENFDFVNDVYLLDRKSTMNRIKSAIKLRSNKYDLVFDFFSNPTTAQITFFTGAKYRVGFPYKGRKYAYNLYGPHERDKFHAAELHTEVLKNIGLSVDKKYLQYKLTENDISFVNKHLADFNLTGSSLIGICPSGGWDSKRCPAEKFAKIADAAAEKFNSDILLLWGPGDKADVDKISRLMKNKQHLAPPTSINEMAAMISKCDLLIANDSGPMHISSAVGTPTLSMHGPTSPKLQGPFGDKHSYVRHEELDCIECNLLECPKNKECFNDLSIEQILEKAETLLSNSSLNKK